MMTATLVSRLLGILKSRVISTCFGAGFVADAINFAYNIPNNFRKLFAEGSLSSAYLPLFSKTRDDDERTAALYRQLASFLLLVFLLLFLLTLAFSRQIIAFMSGFSDDRSIAIAASLLPSFTLFLLFISLSILVSGILQSRRRFLASSIAPIFYTLAILIAVPLLGREFGHYAMAIGVLAGSIAQFAVTLVGLRRLSIRFRFDFRFSCPDFRAVMARWLPGSISSLVAIAGQSISMYLASGLQQGSVSALSYAIIFYQAPYGIVLSAISSVYFPLLSSAADEKERAGMLSKSMTYLYTFLLPAAFIIFALSRECVATLLQKGAFTLDDTLVTAGVLRAYLVAMIPMGFYAMLQRYMYSRDRYYANLVVGIVVTIIDIASTLVFIETGSGIRSLPIASIISSSAGVVILMFFVSVFPWKSFLKGIMKTSLACIPTFVMCIAYMKWNPQRYAMGSTFGNLVYTATTGLVFMAVVALMYLVCRIDSLLDLRRRRS